jgi:hypothetical protein
MEDYVGVDKAKASGLGAYLAARRSKSLEEVNSISDDVLAESAPGPQRRETDSTPPPRISDEDQKSFWQRLFGG